MSVVVSLVSLFFLYHLRSALVAIVILPVAILLSFLAMYSLGITSNIMSLAGIAIAIGAMVDAVIVMIENAHKRLEQWERDGQPGSRTTVIIRAAQEVGKPLFFRCSSSPFLFCRSLHLRPRRDGCLNHSLRPKRRRCFFPLWRPSHSLLS